MDNNRKIFPKSLFWLVLFISIVNALATVFSWYWRIPWLDMPMHFLGGFWVSSVAMWWFYSQIIDFKHRNIFIFSIGVVLIIGSLWEIFGFGIDKFTLVSRSDLALDTISDIIFDVIGAIVSAMYFILKR